MSFWRRLEKMKKALTFGLVIKMAKERDNNVKAEMQVKNIGIMGL